MYGRMPSAVGTKADRYKVERLGFHSFNSFFDAAEVGKDMVLKS
jgi:hypothetical protein